MSISYTYCYDITHEYIYVNITVYCGVDYIINTVKIGANEVVYDKHQRRNIEHRRIEKCP